MDYEYDDMGYDYEVEPTAGFFKKNMTMILIVTGILIAGGVGAFFFFRNRNKKDNK
jgi:hypothetical protein